ncbi:MAG: hypothetical protein U1A27_13660 [Phycisphaerae bacterium]
MAGPSPSSTRSASDPPQGTALPSRRRRRWPWAVGALLLLAIGVVATLPYWIGLPVVTNALLSFANQQLRGTVSAGGASLSWLGPTEARGVTIRDPQGRTVLAAERISCPAGLWGLLTGWRTFGEVVIDNPLVSLYVDEHGDTSLAETFAARHPDANPDSAGVPPQFVGRLRVRSGRVHAERAGGATLDLPTLSLDAQCRTLSDIAGTFSLGFSDGATLDAAAQLTGLIAASGRFSPRDARLKLNARSTQPINLDPVAAIFAPQTGLRGRLTVTVESQSQGDDLTATITATASNLRADAATSAGVQPIDVRLTGKLTRGAERFAAAFDIDSPAGQFNAKLDMGLSARAAVAPTESWNAALSAGRAPALPEMSLTASGKIDLVALSRALPGLVRLRPGQQIQSGLAEVRRITLHGGPQPRGELDLRLEGLTAAGGGRTVRVEPIAITATAGASGDGPLALHADVRSAFVNAQIAASGSKFSAEFRAQLDSLQQQLGQIFDLGNWPLAGVATGKLALSFVSAGQVEADCTLSTEQFRYADSVSGQLHLETKITTQPGAVAFAARGGVDQFSAGSGTGAFRQPRVELACDGRYETERDRLELRQCRVSGAPLMLECAGTIDQLSTQPQVQLSGRYDAAWEELTRLLHQRLPSTEHNLAVRGRGASEFKLAGRLAGAGPSPLAAMSGSAGVAWSAADLFGVEVGAVQLLPRLTDGRLTLPPAEIAAADGKVRLAGEVDFRPAEPLLRLPGQLRLLDKVRLTPELGRELLSRINPIFQFMTRVDGRVSLALADVALPLGPGIRTGGAGAGVLDLNGIRVQPGGVLAELMQLGGLPIEQLYPAEISQVDFVIRDGRIRYDNFTLVFPQGFDLKFYGSVGFDDSLDLVVSLPVTAGLLERLRVRGAAAGVLASGLRVDVPLVGTREKPRLDFARVDTGKLLKGLLTPQGARQGIDTLLRDIARPPPADDQPANKPRGRRKR